jgi:predicted DNA-binding transcriptional regulator AlpA
MQIGDLMTAEQVADLLGIQRRSVYHFARYLDGFPRPSMKLGRTPLWDRKAIEEWREAHPARHRRS